MASSRVEQLLVDAIPEDKTVDVWYAIKVKPQTHRNQNPEIPAVVWHTIEVRYPKSRF